MKGNLIMRYFTLSFCIKIGSCLSIVFLIILFVLLTPSVHAQSSNSLEFLNKDSLSISFNAETDMHEETVAIRINGETVPDKLRFEIIGEHKDHVPIEEADNIIDIDEIVGELFVEYDITIEINHDKIPEDEFAVFLVVTAIDENDVPYSNFSQATRKITLTPKTAPPPPIDNVLYTLGFLPLLVAVVAGSALFLNSSKELLRVPLDTLLEVKANSWITISTAALGAINLGTVTALKIKGIDAVPNKDTFIVLGAIFVAITALAPLMLPISLIFSTSDPKPKPIVGIVGGYFVVSTIALWGLIGQIGVAILFLNQLAKVDEFVVDNIIVIFLKIVLVISALLVLFVGTFKAHVEVMTILKVDGTPRLDESRADKPKSLSLP